MNLVGPGLSIDAGPLEDAFGAALASLGRAGAVERLWSRDHTLWSPSPEEIQDRLGWLDIAERMSGRVEQYRAFAEAQRELGIRRVLLLGMGGSSLAPELFAKCFGSRDGFPVLEILDSTDPRAVTDMAARHPVSDSLFVVSTKSGGTVETLSFLRFFYRRAVEALGAPEAGRRFVAITDPGSVLEAVAYEAGFAKIFHGDPDIGGRFSALSPFGLLPAALIGLDLRRLLGPALRMSEACRSTVLDAESPKANPAALLAAWMSAGRQEGRDKLMLDVPGPIASLTDWLEQLIAESTGKHGTGVLPAPWAEASMSMRDPETGAAFDMGRPLPKDRLLARFEFDAGRAANDALSISSAAKANPIATIRLDDAYDLGGQFVLWQAATALLASSLSINPFDQPNVESAKISAREAVAGYKERGRLDDPMEAQALRLGATDGSGVKASNSSDELRAKARAAAERLLETAAQAEPPAYLNLQAYLPASPRMDALLGELVLLLGEAGDGLVSVGYGPRFLHSTGQLHKGDAGLGIFVQLVSPRPGELAVPSSLDGEGSELDFGTLISAQAAGDAAALQEAGRRVIRVDLGAAEPADALERLVDATESILSG